MKHKILFYQVLFALIGLSYAKAQSQSDLDYTPQFTNRRVVEKNNIRYQEAILNGEKIILATEGTLTSNLLDVMKQDESLKGLIKDTDLKHFLKINDLSADVKLADGDIIHLKMKPDVSKSFSHHLLRGQTLWEIAQLRNINLKSLLNLNGLNEGERPLDGSILYLNSKKLHDAAFSVVPSEAVYEKAKHLEMDKERSDEIKTEKDADKIDQLKEEAAAKNNTSFADLGKMPTSDDLLHSKETDAAGNVSINIKEGMAYDDFANKVGISLGKLKELNPTIGERTFARQTEKLYIGKAALEATTTSPDGEPDNLGTTAITEVKKEVVISNGPLYLTLQKNEYVSKLIVRANKDYPTLNLDQAKLKALNPQIPDFNKVRDGIKFLVGYKMPDGTFSTVLQNSIAQTPTNVTKTDGGTNVTNVIPEKTQTPVSTETSNPDASAGSGTPRRELCQPDSYDNIAKQYGITVEQLIKWNNLSTEKVSIRKPTELIVSMGNGGGSDPVVVKENPIAQTTTPDNAGVTTPTNLPVGATVHPSGDILLEIKAFETYVDFAKRAGISEEKLRYDNQLKSFISEATSPTLLLIGKTTPSTGTVTSQTPITTNTTVVTTVVAKAPITSVPASGFIIAKAGDMMSKIAKDYNIPKATLLLWNKMTETDMLQVGQEVWLRQKDFNDTPVNVEIENYERYQTHKVVKGDLLSSIAKKYDIAVDELKRLNEMSDADLAIDDVLLVKKMAVPSANSEGAGRHVVQAKESLAQICAQYNIAMQDLQTWNGIPEYVTRVASGTGLTLQKPVGMASKIDMNSYTYYAVVSGDNLSKIALANQCTADNLRELNNWSADFTALQPGQSIKVPKPLLPAIRTAYHTVQDGETLSEIGIAYRQKIEDLVKWNGLKNANTFLKKGQELIINEAEFIKKSEPIKTEPKTAHEHTVRKGETYFSISQHYGISVEDLKAANNKRSDVISVGEILKIHK